MAGLIGGEVSAVLFHPFVARLAAQQCRTASREGWRNQSHLIVFDETGSMSEMHRGVSLGRGRSHDELEPSPCSAARGESTERSKAHGRDAEAQKLLEAKIV